MELPMPVTFYSENNIASRTSLWRWEVEGLRIIRKGGRTYVCPQDLREFLLRENDAELRDEAVNEATP